MTSYFRNFAIYYRNFGVKYLMPSYLPGMIRYHKAKSQDVQVDVWKAVSEAHKAAQARVMNQTAVRAQRMAIRAREAATAFPPTKRHRQNLLGEVSNCCRRCHKARR